MPITSQQRAEMFEAAKPLIKWLNDNTNPHCKVIVETDRAELVEGTALVISDEFVKD